jgi:hypothetical protein
MARANRSGNLQKVIFSALAILLVARTALVVITSRHNRVMRAEMDMASGLVLLWIVVGGGLMYLLRDRIKALLQPLAGRWRLWFFLMAVTLALCEEVVTTLMTNCAPLFGVKIGEAYITASTNYLDVVACHSVITFLPAFAVWTWLLSRYNFSPFETFICFGIYGFIAEAIFGGLRWLDIGFWIFVYGLMIYLPAYVFAQHRAKHKVRWMHYVIASVGPFFGTIPWVLLLKFTFLSHHPDVHFPPINTALK